MAFPAYFTAEIAFTDPTASPSWTDVTTYCRGFSTYIGRSFRDEVAQPGWSRLRLDNTDGRFEPGKTNGPYTTTVKAARQIRLRAGASSGTAVGLSQTYITAWQRSFSFRQSETVAEGLDLFLYWERFVLPTGAPRSTENTGARISALTGTFVTVAGTDGYGCVAYDYSGVQQLQALQELAEGSGGLLFIDGGGLGVFQTPLYRTSVARATTAQNAWCYGVVPYGTTNGNTDVEMMTDLSPRLDMDQLANIVRVTAGTGAVQSASDSTSRTAYGDHEYELTTLLTSAAAATRAAGLLAARKDPMTRLAAVSLDGLTSADCMAEILRRQIGDRVTLRVGHPGDGGYWSHDVWIESIAHDVAFDDPRWVTTFEVTPAAAPTFTVYP